MMRPSKSKTTASSVIGAAPTRRARRRGRPPCARRPRRRPSGRAPERSPAVTGPMQATTGGTASTPTASTKRSTVDDDVKVTMSAPAIAARCSSVTAAGTVRYASTTSTVPAACPQAVGEHVARHLGAGQQHATGGAGGGAARRAATPPRSAPGRGRPARPPRPAPRPCPARWRRPGPRRRRARRGRRRAARRAAARPRWATSRPPSRRRPAGRAASRSAAPPSAGSAISITGHLDRLGARARAGARPASTPAAGCASRRPAGRTAAGARTTPGPRAATSPTTITDGVASGWSAMVAERGADGRAAPDGCPSARRRPGVAGSSPPAISSLGDPPDAGHPHEDHDRAADPGDGVASRPSRRRPPPGPRGR